MGQEGDVVREKDWYDLPFDTREELQRAFVRLSPSPREIGSGKEPEDPSIVLADRADNIASARARHRFVMRMGLAGFAVMGLGVALAVTGALLGNMALLWVAFAPIVAGFIAGMAWFCNNDPVETYRTIHAAETEYSRTQRRPG